MENKNIDNVNNPNHYKLGCGVESIEIIKRVLGLRNFVAFCLGNILKYLIRAEKKNKLEDYKKAAKYLEWVIQNYNRSESYLDKIGEANELFKEFRTDWENIMDEIAKDLNINKKKQLNYIFHCVFKENYILALETLRDFIKEYEE
ncbi:DUF3310 domain-containing protein [Fusobacterium nucleatum]|uniref:DUF3310 domain-containing protein n=1 Tax=Fusobacterium nucleatum TaxID=851 RepID=UPI000420BC3D|nr:DUF3310 domain-containing protein [Fusobacterium nucleatum]ALF24744.1 hypothetical protein RO05_10335 [Fusobacterium nucleatum subsp. nucleatum ChDC F316]ASG26018.1 hypothetical protein RN84_03540 [Fusobacterium nucleatum subsp. nucleatum]